MPERRGYRVEVVVREVRGECALGYRPGDAFTVERYYIPGGREKPVCLHALAAMLTFLPALLKGVSARELGIGPEDDVGYMQCPDPGRPYTCGGTVVFELRRRPAGPKGRAGALPEGRLGVRSHRVARAGAL